MNVQPDWWQSFFDGLAVEMWLKAAPEEMTVAEADFIAKTLAFPTGARLLDVPCGGGRHSLTLAARGYRMTGVDLSPAFLKVARAKAAQRGQSVAWEERDMRDLPWEAVFDGAFSLGNSFGYLPDEGNAAFLCSVARTLKPGARFLLDTSYVMEIILPSLQERSWMQVGDILSLSARHYDHCTSRLEVEYSFLKGGERETKRASSRLHSYRELCSMMEQARFTDLQACASLSGEPFKLGAHRLLLSATRS
jgi:SAM-dependent methyltransferase